MSSYFPTTLRSTIPLQTALLLLRKPFENKLLRQDKWGKVSHKIPMPIPKGLRWRGKLFRKLVDNYITLLGDYTGVKLRECIQ